MSDSLSDEMDRFEAAAQEADRAAERRDDIAADVAERRAGHVETAVEDCGTSVELVGDSAGGSRFRFAARLDRASMVAALTDALPDGFVVSHLNEDGSLSVEWTGSDRTPTRRESDVVLKAIVAEEMTTDPDGLITSTPTRERVLDRAAELGFARDDATDRLDRLVRLDMVDVADGHVYPGDNFSRI